MQVFGSNELMEDVIKKDLCIGCGACVDLCPYFKTYKGKTTMTFNCAIAKGRCHASCPKTELDMTELSKLIRGKPYNENPIGFYEEIFSSKAGKKMEKAKFQAGGTVSSLIAYALKTGVIDSAVLTGMEELVPAPRLVTKVEEATLFSTSKYSASPTIAAVNKGAQDGFKKIGVVGTPCQMTAIAKMSINSLGRDDFFDPVALKIGLFCTWALDTKRLISFLSNKLDVTKITGMDIPPPPAEVFVIETVSETINIPLREIRPLVPNSCLFCPDMTSEWADISVGVLEGNPNLNTLIVRTDFGKKLVDGAAKDGFLDLSDMQIGRAHV